MTAGYQPTVNSVNNAVAAMAVSLRNDFATILNFSAWLNTVGASGLQAIGFTGGDASTIVAAVGNLADLAGVYQGQAPQIGLPFNFEDNTSTLWGGQ
jgi:hypothetical protein